MPESRSVWMVAALLGQTGFAGVACAGTPPHRAADEAHEVAFLEARGTPDSLATASLLAHGVETRDAARTPDPSALIRRAVALAPDRPELIWLQLRDCQIRHCAGQESIVARLRAVDSDNGLALLPALSASQAGPALETTRIVAELGASKTLSLYWNKSLVMMFDAMTHGRHARAATAITHGADDRLTHASGVLTAIDLPPLRPIAAMCGSGQLQETGRRVACESLMARLDGSDSIIAQSLSVSVQLGWWPAGSPQAAALRSRRLQQEYLVQAAGRLRAQADADAGLRVTSMRQTATEKEADEAVLTAFHEPVDRPAAWHIPTDQGDP